MTRCAGKFGTVHKFSRGAANGSRCDLLLSTDDGAKARILRKARSQYARGEVLIRVVPNRGRDIGAFLSAFGEDIVARYDIVGHVHGKRSLHATSSSDLYVGERWREFCGKTFSGTASDACGRVLVAGQNVSCLAQSAQPC
jgi:lipopolysaccharide biosynthesis protein